MHTSNHHEMPHISSINKTKTKTETKKKKHKKQDNKRALVDPPKEENTSCCTCHPKKPTFQMEGSKVTCPISKGVSFHRALGKKIQKVGS